MNNTKDMRSLLIQELCGHRIKDTGYDCLNGRHYVEIRNALFVVDSDRIFEGIPNYDISDDWYVENYEPFLYKNNQYNKCLDKICSNPATRQAVLILGNEDEYNNSNGEFICTMYVHIFLDKITDTQYNLQYIVHMRSSDAIEFQSDIKWHRKILNNLIQDIYIKLGIKVNKYTIIWNADSLQLYEKFFNKFVTI